MTKNSDGKLFYNEKPVFLSIYLVQMTTDTQDCIFGATFGILFLFNNTATS
ncbi:MAG: hypothetical protein JWP81_2340 [Ferruginibacter sp.]|nr:hypothetical protein [Ferruginibacter sp.]